MLFPQPLWRVGCIETECAFFIVCFWFCPSFPAHMRLSGSQVSTEFRMHTDMLTHTSCVHGSIARTKATTSCENQYWLMKTRLPCAATLSVLWHAIVWLYSLIFLALANILPTTQCILIDSNLKKFSRWQLKFMRFTYSFCVENVLLHIAENQYKIVPWHS